MTKHNCKRVKSKISKVPKAIARFGLKFYKLTFKKKNQKNKKGTKNKKINKNEKVLKPGK